MAEIDSRYMKYENYVNRELSWLEFDHRILEEARDKTLPLFERLKFLSITASNLDEFFMVRVASLKDMVHAGYVKPDVAGLKPEEQLRKIEEKVRNTAAHTITRVDERWLKDRGVVSSQEVVKLLKAAVQTLNQDSGGTVSARLAVDWGAYDVMNRKIEAAL